MKMIRDFIEVNDHISLDSLIEALTAARAALPEGAAADVRMKGDDIFGRKLSISYLRPQTAEEAALDARYAETCQVHSAGADPDLDSYDYGLRAIDTIHHSAKLPSAQRQTGLRPRWPSRSASRTAYSSLSTTRPGPRGVERNPPSGVRHPGMV